MPIEAISPRAAVAASNLWKLSVLAEILERLARDDIPVIVLKGAALLGWLYDLHERPMSDIDLLIRPTDRERFLLALAPEVELTARRSVGVLGGYGEGQFPAYFRGVALDVHLHLFASPWLRRLVPVDENGLWRRSVAQPIAGTMGLRLSPEDQLLHFAGHLAFHHADHSLPYRGETEDVRRFLATTPVDWERVVGLATRQQMRTVTWLLLMRHDLVGVVPGSTLARLRPSALASWRVTLAEHLARAGDRSVPAALLTDSPLGLARAVVVAASPPSEWLRLRFGSAPGLVRVLLHWQTIAASGLGRLASTRRTTAGPTQGRRRLSLATKASLVRRTWTSYAIVELELRRRTLPEVVRRLAAARVHPTERIEPRRLGQIVSRVLRIGDRGPRCLTSALVHFRLLAEQGHRPELVIGLHPTAATKDAHAWIELNGVEIGPPPGRGEHIALARYGGR